MFDTMTTAAAQAEHARMIQQATATGALLEGKPSWRSRLVAHLAARLRRPQPLATVHTLPGATATAAPKVHRAAA